jgi:hypothetical protein
LSHHQPAIAPGKRVKSAPDAVHSPLTIAGLHNPGDDMAITEDQVNAAQQAWCDGLVEIGRIHQAGGDFRAAALAFINGLYDYAEGVVFFKPTMAHGKQTFRDSAKGALSYFVAGDPDFPDDKGFALKPWARVWYENNAAENGIQIHGNIGITMGNVYLADHQGNETMVDKTFVFRLCSDRQLRLCVHKSALPYSPTS